MRRLDTKNVRYRFCEQRKGQIIRFFNLLYYPSTLECAVYAKAHYDALALDSRIIRYVSTQEVRCLFYVLRVECLNIASHAHSLRATAVGQPFCATHVLIKQ